MVQLKRKVTLKEKHEFSTSDTIPFEPNNQQESSNDSSSVHKNKPKSWLPFLLCGLLIVGAGIYFLTRNSSGNEKTYASNDVNEGKTEIKNEDSVIPVSDDLQISVENTTSVVENKDMISNEVAGVVENKEELLNPDNSIVENMVSPSKVAESNTESVERREAIPVSEIERTAKEVIRGKYGNGRIRKDKLGDQYSVVQSKVNEMYRNHLN